MLSDSLVVTLVNMWSERDPVIVLRDSLVFVAPYPHGERIDG